MAGNRETVAVSPLSKVTVVMGIGGSFSVGGAGGPRLTNQTMPHCAAKFKRAERVPQPGQMGAVADEGAPGRGPGAPDLMSDDRAEGRLGQSLFSHTPIGGTQLHSEERPPLRERSDTGRPRPRERIKDRALRHTDLH